MAKKILVVDDDPIVRAVVANGFKKDGWECCMAADGNEGLQLALNSQPNVIILDVMLPKMDGTEVARAVMENYATQHIPIIYMTGIDEKEKNMLGRTFKPDMVFLKPVNLKALLAKANEVLSLNSK